MRTLTRLLVAVALAVIVGCSGDSDDSAETVGEGSTTETTNSTTTSTTAVVAESAPATDTPSTEAPTTDAPTTEAPAVPAGCTPADLADIDAITAGLTDGATSIDQVFKADGADGYRYIGANIYDASGERLSSADVWVFDGTVAYSLSGSARNQYATELPDGVDELSLSAGDEYGTEVQDCVIASLRGG